VKHARQTHNGRAKLLVVELNEFSVELFRHAAKELDLPNISRMLTWRHTLTTTVDRIEHQGLDPWVQWVGIHSGVPTSEHGVKRLGLTRIQSRKQIWHVLADRGFRWAVWGAMNAPLGNTSGCAFFMPDPWSFDETAYPSVLNRLLSLPRYVSKNYLEINKGLALRYGLRFLSFFSPRWWAILPRLSIVVLDSLARGGANVHTFTTLLDHLSVLVFVALRRRHDPDFSLIFLNHVAHVQHHFWRRSGRMHPQMRLALRLCDSALGLLTADAHRGEAILVLNGLKQVNVAGDGDYCYRQRNPEEALRAIGLRAFRIEQCMTNDGLILFETAADAQAGEQTLRCSALSDGTKAFYVDRVDQKSVFYQIHFDHHVAPGTNLIAGARSVPFDQLFELVTERTGAHIAEGDVYACGIDVKPVLQNHEIFNEILEHFQAASLAGT